MRLENIISYLEGNDNAELKQSIQKWMEESDENKGYIEKVRKVWFAIDEMKALSAIDVNKDWHLVEQRLRSKTSATRSLGLTRRFQTVKLVRVAAVFVLGVVFSGLLFYLTNTFQREPQQADGFYEVMVPEGQKSNLVLPDGTKILVNAGTKLRLPKGNSSQIREVWMDGEAFFKVAKDPRHPFIVHTSDVNVQVLGTTFNVRAYDEESVIETTLLEGKVMLGKANGKPEVSLSPNRKAIFIKNDATGVSASLHREFGDKLDVGQILVSEPIDPELATAWTKGKLMFDNEYFEVVAGQLERYYGLQINIQDESLKSIRYSGSIKNISLDQALRALQITTPFQYRINDNEVIITK